MYLDHADDIALYRLITLCSALRLECAGMRAGKINAYAIVKRELGFTGSRARVLDQLTAYLDRRKAERGAARDVVRPHLPDGCTVLSARYAAPDRVVVIAEREHDYHPFVVWSHYPNGCPGVHHGQYFATIEEATAAYVTR